MRLCSDCCSAPPAGNMEEYGICGACKEHCEFWDDEENECNDWIQEDEDYARQCADEKWRSNHP